MSVQFKKQHVKGDERYVPSFHFAWEYMDEEDKKALVELEEKYRLLAKQTVDS
jgi:hypothetical protein